jgi:protoporphyrinogen oxidase
MLGLTLAHRLSAAGHDVTVLEAAPELGGLASAWSLGDIVWDRHYHVTLLSDVHVRQLLTELDLDGELRWVETKTGFYTDGQLYPMSNTLEFLRFPPLGLAGKCRLALTILYASRVRNWRRLEGVLVADWLRRLSGRRTFERIWLPLLRAKLGENYRRTSAAFIWATIARMYAARRTGLKKEMFGYVSGGYARILSRFAGVLRNRGVHLILEAPVSRVTRAGTCIRVTAADGVDRAFDRVVVTAPGPVAAAMCPDLSAAEAARLKGIEYQGIVCASLLVDRPLSPYYITNITEAGVPFTAVIEMSALVDRTQFGGRSLVYLPRYAVQDDPIFAAPDEQIRQNFVDALMRMHPDLRPDQLLAFRVSRARYVQPLSTLHYSTRVPAMKTSVPGLFFVNSSQITNGTLNVNETINLANRSASNLLTDEV